MFLEFKDLRFWLNLGNLEKRLKNHKKLQLQ